MKIEDKFEKYLGEAVIGKRGIRINPKKGIIGRKMGSMTKDLQDKGMMPKEFEKYISDANNNLKKAYSNAPDDLYSDVKKLSKSMDMLLIKMSKR